MLADKSNLSLTVYTGSVKSTSESAGTSGFIESGCIGRGETVTVESKIKYERCEMQVPSRSSGGDGVN